jgi:hypothetical protein
MNLTLPVMLFMTKNPAWKLLPYGVFLKIKPTPG